MRFWRKRTPTNNGRRKEDTAPETRLGFGEFGGSQNFGARAEAFIQAFFALDFRHFLIVRRDPDGTAGGVLDLSWKCGGQFRPEPARIRCQLELRGRIVHHHKMAHTCRRCAAANYTGFDDHDLQPRGGACGRTGRADDSGSGDRYVTDAHDRRIP
jgi:hypothetical protein